MERTGKNANKYAVWAMWAVVLLYGACCLYLFYMQSIQPLDYNNRYYQSDLPYHISMIIEDGWYYSFTAYIYQLLYFLGGGKTGLIAAFLAVVTVLCVVVTERLLRRFLAKDHASVLTVAGALALNLVMPFFMKMAGQYRYVSYQSGNLWHNSTYQCMKLFALASMLYYLEIEESYREKITAKQWLVFAGLLILCTGIKPSFLTVFAPVLAVKLLWDLCKKVRFKQLFLLGSTVLPACFVVLWQNMVLFGEDTGNGFTIDPWYSFSLHADRPKLAVLCSIAFPLVVLVFSLKELLHNKTYLFVWGMAGVGFLEALCLVETGSRSRDGNFLWGYCFAIFMLMVVSFVRLLQLLKEKTHVVIYRVGFALGGITFLYQLFCGVIFFVRLMQGETYFMMG
ncbi:MAG: hypothetical protein ACI4TB_07185 [Lachnospiraceae bacterium]